MLIIGTHDKEKNPLFLTNGINILSKNIDTYFSTNGYDKIFSDHLNSIYRRIKQ
jgi:hypothetical protein